MRSATVLVYQYEYIQLLLLPKMLLCYDVSDLCGGLPAALRCVVLCAACFPLLSARLSVVLWPIRASRGLLLYQPNQLAEAAGLFVRERCGKCDSAHSLSRGGGVRPIESRHWGLYLGMGRPFDKMSTVFRAWLILCHLLDSVWRGLQVYLSRYLDFRKCYRCGES